MTDHIISWLKLPSLTILDCSTIEDQSVIIHREDPRVRPENFKEILERDDKYSLEADLQLSKMKYKKYYNPKGISVHILASQGPHPKPHPRTESCYILPISKFHDYFIIIDGITEEMMLNRETSQAETVHPNVVHANLYQKSLECDWMDQFANFSWKLCCAGKMPNLSDDQFKEIVKPKHPSFHLFLL
jgi:hypothetical protein